MKKPIFFLILMIAAVLATPALAGAPTEYAIPDVGTELNGFVVTDVSYFETYATDVVELTHQKTGSVLYWLANDSINRSYIMWFQTPITNNTGIAHVFEHATLGGNKKYPGANTYFEMLEKTSNTYLNASTAQYYTFYPMASASEDQLYQYVDYYMNGLTDPLAISNIYAMMREAYRYELDDPEGDISLQGVVYSEMLGSLTQSRCASYNFMRMLWPDSNLTYVSGGDPAYIPDLTIDALREFHETYYHPSNATMYLAGDLNLPHFLELLDTEFLSRFEKREIPIEDTGYTPLQPGYYEQVFQYPVETGTPTENAALMYYGKRCDVQDIYDQTILDYVCSYMNDESSPFKRLMLERLPQASVSASFMIKPGNKTSLVFFASGVNESEKDLFRDTCDEALAAVLKDGVDEVVLNAILVNTRFYDLMKLDDSAVYLSLSESMGESWSLYGQRNIWKVQDAFNNHLNENVTVERLNETARKYFADLDTNVLAITVPAPGLKEENDALLRKQLDEKKAAMTPDEIDDLIKQTKAFHEYVEESNKILMPDSLNALSVATLPEEYPYKPASETTLDGIRMITSEIDTPLIQISFFHDASVIPFDDLLDFKEFAHLIDVLGTDLYTREEILARKASVSSGMSILMPVMYENPDTREYQYMAMTSWYALPETLEETFKMVEDVLYHVDFSDYDFIRSDAAQRHASYIQVLSSNALSLGLYAARSPYSNLSKLYYYLSGEKYLNYLDKVSKMTDAELDALVSKFYQFRDMILNKNGVSIGIMGRNENIMKAAALGYHMVSGFNDAEQTKVDYIPLISDLPLHYGLVTGGNVAYNLSLTDIESLGLKSPDGRLTIVAKVLNDKFLYPEVRVKNSAYGGYCMHGDYVFGFYSYRDPNVKETYDVYKKAGDFLRTLEITDKELEGYITSAYGDLVVPVGPLSTAAMGLEDKLFNDNTYEKVLKLIRDYKSFTAADIPKYISVVEKAGSDDAVRLTVGAKSMIEGAGDTFDEINYNLLESSDSTEIETTAQNP